MERRIHGWRGWITGFTLVEVLVTLLVASLLLSAVHAVFLGSLSAKKYCEDQSGRKRLAQAILILLERDLRGAFAPEGVTPCFLSRSESGQGGAADGAEFVSTSDARRTLAGRGADHVELGYRAEPDPDAPGLYRLIRRESHGISGDPFQGGTLEVLADRVVSFELTYLDTDNNWTREWAGDGLPRAARVSLVLAGKPREDGEQGPSTTSATTVVLPAGGER